MLTDFYCKTYEEAAEERRRRKASLEGQEMVHRILDSPYGGYCLRSQDAELYFESILDGPAIGLDRRVASPYR